MLGPARGEGNKMAQWVLKANGLVVPRRSVRPLHQSEVHSPSEQSKRQAFDALIERRYGNSIVAPATPAEGYKTTEPYEDDGQQQFTIPDIEDSVDSTGRLINQCPAYDCIINAEVQMQLEEQVMKGTVKRHVLGPDGRTTGKYDDSPYRNSIVYEVEFADGEVREYMANLIAEGMLAQVDTEGNHLQLMEGIVDWRCDDSLAMPRWTDMSTTNTVDEDYAKPHKAGGSWSSGRTSPNHGCDLQI